MDSDVCSLQRLKPADEPHAQGVPCSACSLPRGATALPLCYDQLEAWSPLVWSQGGGELDLSELRPALKRSVLEDSNQRLYGLTLVSRRLSFAASCCHEVAVRAPPLTGSRRNLWRRRPRVRLCESPARPLKPGPSNPHPTRLRSPPHTMAFCHASFLMDGELRSCGDRRAAAAALRSQATEVEAVAAATAAAENSDVALEEVVARHARQAEEREAKTLSAVQSSSRLHKGSLNPWSLRSS